MAISLSLISPPFPSQNPLRQPYWFLPVNICFLLNLLSPSNCRPQTTLSNISARFSDNNFPPSGKLQQERNLRRCALKAAKLQHVKLTWQTCILELSPCRKLNTVTVEVRPSLNRIQSIISTFICLKPSKICYLKVVKLQHIELKDLHTDLA